MVNDIYRGNKIQLTTHGCNERYLTQYGVMIDGKQSLW